MGQKKHHKDAGHVMLKNYEADERRESLCEDRSAWKALCYQNKDAFWPIYKAELLQFPITCHSGLSRLWKNN